MNERVSVWGAAPFLLLSANFLFFFVEWNETNEKKSGAEREKKKGEQHKERSHKPTIQFISLGRRNELSWGLWGGAHLPRANSTQPNSFRLSSLHLPCFHFHQCCSAIRKTSLPFNQLINSISLSFLYLFLNGIALLFERWRLAHNPLQENDWKQKSKTKRE